MGTQKLAGFTIIETMLFLGISGILVVAMLVGVGASINVQRYRDAAESFKSLVQKQYADLNNVQNSRSANWSCGATATPVEDGPNPQARGQSDCMLIGKYMRIDRGDIAVYQVVGYKGNNSPVTNDIETLKNNYLLNVNQETVDESNMEWGTQISYPVVQDGVTNPNPTPRKVGILIVKSPESGQIYTFTNSDAEVPDKDSLSTLGFSNMLIAGDRLPGQGARMLCVDGNGLLTANDRGVYINTFAASTSAVEMRSNDFMEARSQRMKC